MLNGGRSRSVGAIISPPRTDTKSIISPSRTDTKSIISPAPKLSPKTLKKYRNDHY